MSYLTEAELIIAWVRAQLGEDERVATDIHRRGCRSVTRSDAACDCDAPDERLAKIEADRQTLAWLADCEAKALDGNWWNLDVVDAAKAMALPYAARDGYREEWRP